MKIIKITRIHDVILDFRLHFNILVQLDNSEKNQRHVVLREHNVMKCLFSTVRLKKKRYNLIFGYFQKLYELALDIYGAFTRTL